MNKPINRILTAHQNIEKMANIESDDDWLFCSHCHSHETSYSTWKHRDDSVLSFDVKISGNKAIIKKNSLMGKYSPLRQRKLLERVQAHIRSLEPIPGPKDNILITGVSG